MKRLRVITIVLFFMVIALISYSFGRPLMSGESPQLSSFMTINFIGYLFFITLPVEAMIPVYLGYGFSPVVLFFAAIVTALISQLIDYGIGRAVPEDVIKEIIGSKRYEKYFGLLCKHGYWIIFLFNVLPLSSPIILLVAGIMRIDLKKTLFYSVSGLAIKYLVLVVIF